MLKRLALHKDYLLIAGIIVLAIISYHLAFKRTLEAWQTNKRLKGQLAVVQDLNYQPGYLKRKNANLDSIIKQYQADTLNFRDNSIGIIVAIAEKQNVKINEVPVQDASFNTEKFLIQKLTFEGDFFSLTKTLNSLQNANGIGFVRNITYRLSKLPENQLSAEVYLQVAK